MSVDICERLKAERNRLDLSQEAVASVVEVSPSSVKRWEKDTPIPSDKLAQLYQQGFDVLYILTGHNLPAASNVREEPTLYGLTESQMASHMLNIVMDVQEEVGAAWTKEQLQMLIGYAYDHTPTKESLVDFVEMAYAITGTIPDKVGQNR